MPYQDGKSPYEQVLSHPTCKFEQFESPCSILTSDIISRIIANRCVGLEILLFCRRAPQ
jgi:hypothetical protein